MGSGCLIGYNVERKVVRTPIPAQTVPRPDALPGHGELGADGTLRFVVELDKLCQRTRSSREEIGKHLRKRFTPAGLALMGLSIAALPVGIGMLVAGIKDNNTGLAIGGVIGVVSGFTGTIMLPLFRYGPGTPEIKDYEKTDERIIQEGTELIPCPTGAAVLGELQVVTPWGASTTARPSGTGVAVFAVDWGIERAGELSKDQLATAWQVTAPTLKLAARWTPSAGETDRLAKLVAAASARVVVGATAPQIEATIEAGGKGIQIGGTGQLVLTVQNKGGSTATKLTAKTRSSMPALHGLTFSFGTVQPGASASRTQEVKIAEDVVDDSATILVIFSEGGGHAPAELTKILPLARAVCPGGRLTRQKYDEKRTKLKRAVAAGDMSKEDFEKYDAELLRCLD